MKVSLHGSGICHVKVAHGGTVETKPRWKRPPTPATGALHVATVSFPGGYNRGFRPAVGTPKKSCLASGLRPKAR